jgi:hypothetical protein
MFLPLLATIAFAAGDVVRLTRSETLMFKNENFLGAPKGQEFDVLKHDRAQRLVYVSFYKEDGTLIAVTLPDEALEPAPDDGWRDLRRGLEAFRDQRPEAARALLTRAAQDQNARQLAATITARLATPKMLRETTAQLVQLGHHSLALPLEIAADRLGAPPATLDRVELTERANTANQAVLRARQAIALRKLHEASLIVAAGLKAEPARPELKAYEARIAKDMAEADANYENANRMRRFEKGPIHALTGIEQGLKLCADHPKLRALKQEMSAAFEERTSPPINAALLKLAGDTPAATLEEGRKLYTTRCAECHELELLDSRTIAAWREAVASMARRAKIDGTQQARIIAYLTAAQRTLE